MNASYAGLAAIILAVGTAAGFTAGTQMMPDSGGEDQQALVEMAALVEEQRQLSNTIAARENALEKQSSDLLSDMADLGQQLQELNSRQEQVDQQKAELDAQAEALEDKQASLEALEEDLTRMHSSLLADMVDLENRKTELAKQEEQLAASVASAGKPLALADEPPQDEPAQSTANEIIELAQDTGSKLLPDDGTLLPEPALNALSSGPEQDAVALLGTTSSEGGTNEDVQAGEFIPAAAVAGGTDLPANGMIAEVHFEVNSAQLTPGALKRARDAAEKLQNMEFSKIRIAGHTDTTGSSSLNSALSNERAEAVAAIFVNAGLSRQAIEIVGFGETLAMLPISTADGVSEPLNRCVGIFVE